jgi:hypothetical protein
MEKYKPALNALRRHPMPPRNIRSGLFFISEVDVKRKLGVELGRTSI